MLASLCDPADPATSSARTLVFVSCGFESLTWQLPRLVEGGWAVEASEGFALFPGSDHVETLVVLSRPSRPGH